MRMNTTITCLILYLPLSSFTTFTNTSPPIDVIRTSTPGSCAQWAYIVPPVSPAVRATPAPGCTVRQSRKYHKTLQGTTPFFWELETVLGNHEHGTYKVDSHSGQRGKVGSHPNQHAIRSLPARNNACVNSLANTRPLFQVGSRPRQRSLRSKVPSHRAQHANHRCGQRRNSDVDARSKVTIPA
jgi:hypothetical protein